MLNFEEELKKFQPSLEVDEIEEEALSEDLTDLSDLLKRYLGNNEITERGDINGYQRRTEVPVPVLV